MLIGLTTVLAVMVGSCFGLTRTVSHPQHKVVHFHGRNSMKLRSHGLDTQQLLDMLTASIQAVPVDISAFDKVATLGPGTPELVPDTTIKTLDGGDNLGALVWAVVLYNGIFLSGKPADWVLPPLAAALSSSEESWFKDYRAGYSFRTPPVVDFMRFALFLVAGYYFNVLIVTSLGGDTFWGWSIATCLAIPSGLLNASRPRRLSREEVELEVFNRNLFYCRST